MSNYILYLPSWYPNKLRPFDGDFIQRHARATGLFRAVYVICFIRDEKGDITKNVKTEDFFSEGIYEKIVYYHSPKFPITVIDKFFSGLKYRKLYKKIISDQIGQKGTPSLVHVHIAMKAGLIARWLKRKINVPYVVSEHWTGYLPEAKDDFFQHSFYYKLLWRRIMKKASGISVVSNYLGKAIKKELPGINFSIIPNVVNTEIFKPVNKNDSTITNFIHISGLNYQKNPEDIFKAFSLVKKTNPNFHLSVVGPDNDELRSLIKSFDLESQISFHLEIPQQELAKLVQQTDALILYSRYETFGCVIIEANACGLPVIVSDLEVFKETITEGENGIFVQGENPAALAEKLLWFMQNKKQFNSAAISTKAHSLYNYKRIGKQFSDWYDSILSKQF